MPCSRLPQALSGFSADGDTTPCLTHSVIRHATLNDLPAVRALYQDLHPGEDAAPTIDRVYAEILARGGLSILLLEVDGLAVATTYLNVIPNLTRRAAPYAVIENVVVARERRGQGLGKQIMAATLEEAWRAGCYKAMLQIGRASCRERV